MGRCDVLNFPLAPRMRITQLARRSPALAAVAERLPPQEHVLRGECERLLAKAFTRILHLPELTWEEAQAALAHEASPDVFAEAELSHLAANPETAERHGIWEELWSGEDEQPRRVIRYYMALLARLYRLEPSLCAQRTA